MPPATPLNMPSLMLPNHSGQASSSSPMIQTPNHSHLHRNIDPSLQAENQALYFRKPAITRTQSTPYESKAISYRDEALSRGVSQEAFEAAKQQMTRLLGSSSSSTQLSISQGSDESPERPGSAMNGVRPRTPASGPSIEEAAGSRGEKRRKLRHTNSAGTASSPSSDADNGSGHLQMLDPSSSASISSPTPTDLGHHNVSSNNRVVDSIMSPGATRRAVERFLNGNKPTISQEMQHQIGPHFVLHPPSHQQQQQMAHPMITSEAQNLYVRISVFDLRNLRY